jgi:hypothetical protein
MARISLRLQLVLGQVKRVAGPRRKVWMFVAPPRLAIATLAYSLQSLMALSHLVHNRTGPWLVRTHVNVGKAVLAWLRDFVSFEPHGNHGEI